MGVRVATTHIYGFVLKMCIKSSAISEHMFTVQSIFTDNLPLLKTGGKTRMTSQQQKSVVRKSGIPVLVTLQNWSTLTIAMVNRHPFAIVLTKEKKEKLKIIYFSFYNAVIAAYRKRLK